jgi:creatinine amidohydrolase/Fe(II)-dependent formamide hydrolase-like protein
VDLFNAEFFSDALGSRFLEKYPDWNVVNIPSIMAGSFAFDAVGSIIVQPKTIRNLLVDYLSSLAKYGFRYFIISNAHGGPTHIVALEEAARIVSKRYQVRAISFTGHLIWEFLRGRYWPEIKKELNLTEEESLALKEDAHAGQWETSMMLMLRPELVDPSYKNLSPFTAKLYERFEHNYPLKKGEKLGYIGHPSHANEQFAEVSSKFLIEKAFQMVEDQLLSKNPPRPSMFYRSVLFRTNFVRYFVALVILAVLVGLAFYMFK